MLRLLSPIYGKIADLRNSLYDRGIFKSHDLGAHTISIGNITTGGTGKTPLVAYVAEMLANRGERVCVLTRGYGRESSGRVLVSDGTAPMVDSRTGGDEPVELANRLAGKAMIVADADRVAAAAWSIEKFGVTRFVLDDAFQHRRAKRDIDIVCIDATDPCGSGRVLPEGRLREPFHNLARATAIVLTRANLADDVDAIIERLRKRNSNAPIFASRNRIAGTTRLGEPGTVADSDLLRRHGHGEEVRVLAFCGLGNPDAFFSDLDRASKEIGLDVAGQSRFPDHHVYSQNDIVEIERQAREAGTAAVVTTAKDAVKLDGLSFSLPCFIVQSEIVMEDAAAFRNLITSS